MRCFITMMSVLVAELLLKIIKHITVATMFTIARIALTPVIVYYLLAHCFVETCFLFIVAALTDVIDGYIARRYNQKTFLGAVLDPLADKILLLSVFGSFFYMSLEILRVPGWFVCLLVSKELLQIFGAILLYIKRGWVAIKANVWGKITTLSQILFIVWLFYCILFGATPSKNVFNGFLIIMSFIMCLSFEQYCLVWLKKICKRR